MEEHAQAAGVRVNDEDVLNAVGELACSVGFDMGAVAQGIRAVAESYRRAQAEGGGTQVILISMSNTNGNRMVPHTPRISGLVPVQRRKVG